MNIERSTLRHLITGVVSLLLMQASLCFATSFTPSQFPLFLSVVGNKPNIMLMLDNSLSMNDPLPSSTSPDDMPSGYTFTCNGNQNIGNGVSSGTPSNSVFVDVTNRGGLQTCWSNCSGRNSSNNWYTVKTSSSDTNQQHKCFNVTKIYTVVGSDGSSLGTFTGLKLDWYFATGSFDSALGLTQASDSRITVAKATTKSLIDSLNSNVRVGLATYYCPGGVSSSTDCNGENGGQLLAEVGDLTSSKKTALKTAVDNMALQGYTPLGETLSDIGRYFTTGTTATTLKLHPDSATPTNTAIGTIFNSHSLHNGTGTTSTWAAPIQSSCQKSYAVLITDGLPTKDLAISSSMIGYTDTAAANNLNPATSLGNRNYLDDVANTLADIDLRPDLTKNTPGTKNNLSTFTIGFGTDPDLTTTGVALLNTTANLGLGQAVFAEGGAALATALEAAISEITSREAASAAIAANSSRLDGSTMVYQAKFDSSDWIGNLLGFDLNNTTGDIITPELWDAGKQIPAYGSSPGRTILTYRPGSGTTTPPTGTTFECANLNADQKTYLGVVDCTDAADLGVLRINYLKGDWSHEEVNPNRSDADTKRSTDPDVAIFRNRTHLDSAKHSVTPDPWLLGDIVSSNPVYVSNEDYGYSSLPGTEGSSYVTYRTGTGATAQASTRRAMLYVGANDGMLHGFDAGAYTTSTASHHTSGTGAEKFAYIPNAVYDHLVALTQPNYRHQFYVDGSPRVADAYFPSGSPSWHTVLIGTTGSGGQGVFALDITDPDSMSGSKVMWEISDSYTPNTSPVNELSNDTSALRGFGNNLGYTIPQPALVRMANGDWAVILANGYGSVNNKAILYILSVTDGHIIRSIDTGAGPSTSTDPPNGLSTPIPVDTNGDFITDYIYAGDLYGNLWKFDVTSDTPASWGIAFSGSPLYVACVTNASACTQANRQPITSRPEVGRGPLTNTYMVYFGTGKYLETSDNDVTSTTPQTQTFYAILDAGAKVDNRDSLKPRTISQELAASGNIKYDLRFTSGDDFDYSGNGAKKGWYLDLLKPSATTSDGERIIASPILRGDRVIFTTIIPVPPTVSSGQCGMNGTGWLMELVALTGKPLPAAGPPWDINRDGAINADDLVNGVSPSGLRPGSVGMPTLPSIVKLPATPGSPCKEKKFITGSQATMDSPSESCSDSTTLAPSRQSWRQLR